MAFESELRTASLHGMGRSLVRILTVIAFGTFVTIAIQPLFSEFSSGQWSAGWVAKALGLLCVVALVTWPFYLMLKRLMPRIESAGETEAAFLENLSLTRIDAAILCSAALSLFLELAIIRWQSSVLPFIALYKNFSLLACFLGLGLGYALAGRDRILLIIVLPLLAWQFGLILFVRYGLGTANIVPVHEQLTMGLRSNISGDVFQAGVLALIFLLTALAFMPIGQLCGRLMERRSKLRSYGLNLLGSLLGVLLMLLASFIWTPPLVWFAVCFVAILFFTPRTGLLMAVGLCAAAVCIVILAWPVNPTWNRIYSPYQILEVGPDDDTGLTRIRAAGHYYQRIFDFGDPRSTRWEATRKYYDFPFKAQPRLTDVAIVGAGTGNDVAAAVRNGAGRVEAIEIDPAIQTIGKLNHPEKPYSNPHVHAEINDARSYFRTSREQFDLIVYGLLDSHTLLSQGSSVRIDSFVYTIEGLREARARLKPDGVLSLSFSMLSDKLGHKIYLMLQQAFDGRPPICIAAGYDQAIIFLESNDPKWTLSPAVLRDSGFADVTARYADPTLHADVSTDDWPFFYMPERVYPVSYLLIILEILLLSVILVGNFTAEAPKFSHASYFFLGAGFMLIETKGITELGLTFGNTWQVIGVVIAGILTMAFLGNCAVQWLNLKGILIPYLLLFGGIVLGWYIARIGGLPSSAMGRIGTAIILTLPILFSGIVFSTLLTRKGAVSGMMAMNLLGAIFGGLLEYNSMYFGFRFLYLIAIGCYLLAFLSDLATRSEYSEEVSYQHAARPVSGIR